MARDVTLKLDVADIFQILDALNSRAEAWEKTADALEGSTDTLTNNANTLGLDAFDSFFIPEECDDSEEAQSIASYFRDIITKINTQFDQKDE